MARGTSGILALALLTALIGAVPGTAQTPPVVTAPTPSATAAPEYLVDPFWPKPLPNRWGVGHVADGYGNRRIIVFDSNSGAYRRHWGAYGERPPADDVLPAYQPGASATAPARFFRNPVHCVRLARDGLVYVCDRVNNRVQVFRRDGSFVQEFFVARETRLNGAVADLVPSPDPAQRFLYMVDNTNSVARVLRRRDGEVLSTFGRMGRYAGQFMVPHNVAVDSQGNLYVTEVDTGQRVQRFRRTDPQR